MNALDSENMEEIEQLVIWLSGDLTIIVASHGSFFKSNDVYVITL